MLEAALSRVSVAFSVGRSAMVFTLQRLSAMPLWDAALWGQSAQSPGVSIPRTPKRLGARPETPTVESSFVSIVFQYL